MLVRVIPLPLIPAAASDPVVGGTGDDPLTLRRRGNSEQPQLPINRRPLLAATPLIGRRWHDMPVRLKDSRSAVNAQTWVTANRLPLNAATPLVGRNRIAQDNPNRRRDSTAAINTMEDVAANRPPPASGPAPFEPVDFPAPRGPRDSRAAVTSQTDVEGTLQPLANAVPFEPTDTAPIFRARTAQHDIEPNGLPLSGTPVASPFEPVDTVAPVNRRAAQQPDNVQNTLPLTAAPPATAPFLATDFGVPTSRALREIPQFLGTWAGLLGDIPPTPAEPRRGPADDRRRRKRRHDPAEVEAWRRHREEREKELERIAAEMLAAIKDAAPEDEPQPPVVADAAALLETPEEASNARIRRLQAIMRRLMAEMDRLGVALEDEEDEETAFMLLVA